MSQTYIPACVLQLDANSHIHMHTYKPVGSVLLIASAVLYYAMGKDGTVSGPLSTVGGLTVSLLGIHVCISYV